MMYIVLMYYIFTANVSMKPIKVEDFDEHLVMLQSNMCEQFQTDYESIASDTEYSFHAAKLVVNVNKNRYKNIIPCKYIRSYVNKYRF